MATRRVCPIYRKAAVLTFLLALSCPRLFAQRFLHVPTIDVFAGYSYLRFDSKPLGYSGQMNLNGWNFELALPHIYRGLGAVGDVSANYGHELSAYNFLIGPQYTVEVGNIRIFGHGLFGRSRDRVGLPGTTEFEPSNVARDIAFGGGVDIPLGDKVWWRAVQADYMVTSNFAGTQHNIRASTGIVFRFGKH
jgi:hypothetical protein